MRKEFGMLFVGLVVGVVLTYLILEVPIGKEHSLVPMKNVTFNITLEGKPFSEMNALLYSEDSTINQTVEFEDGTVTFDSEDLGEGKFYLDVCYAFKFEYGGIETIKARWVFLLSEDGHYLAVNYEVEPREWSFDENVYRVDEKFLEKIL